MIHVIDIGQLSAEAKALLRIATEYRVVYVKARSLARTIRHLGLTRDDRAELRSLLTLRHKLRGRRMRLRSSYEAESLRQTINCAVDVVAEACLLGFLRSSRRLCVELQCLLRLVMRTGLLSQRRNVA